MNYHSSIFHKEHFPKVDKKVGFRFDVARSPSGSEPICKAFWSGDDGNSHPFSLSSAAWNQPRLIPSRNGGNKRHLKAPHKKKKRTKRNTAKRNTTKRNTTQREVRLRTSQLMQWAVQVEIVMHRSNHMTIFDITIYHQGMDP